MKFVGIKQNLVKGSISPLKGTTFLNPCSCRFCCCDIDLVFTGSCDSVSQFSHDILFFQNINESAVIFLRHKITTIGIYTFLQNIGYLTEVRTKCSKHPVLVLIRCTSNLHILWLVCHRLGYDRNIHRLTEFILHRIHLLHSFDFKAIILDLLFHFRIGSSIFCRKKTVLITLAFHKCFCTFPCLVSCFS